jgi:hypothetical protein
MTALAFPCVVYGQYGKAASAAAELFSAPNTFSSWTSATFQACLQASRHRRLDAHRPVLTRTLYGGCQ